MEPWELRIGLPLKSLKLWSKQFKNSNWSKARLTLPSSEQAWRSSERTRPVMLSQWTHFRWHQSFWADQDERAFRGSWRDCLKVRMACLKVSRVCFSVSLQSWVFGSSKVEIVEKRLQSSRRNTIIAFEIAMIHMNETWKTIK